MPIANQTSDPIQAGINFIGVQSIQAAIKLADFRLKPLTRNVMKCVGVPFRQLACEKLQIVPRLGSG